MVGNLLKKYQHGIKALTPSFKWTEKRSMKLFIDNVV